MLFLFNPQFAQLLSTTAQVIKTDLNTLFIFKFRQCVLKAIHTYHSSGKQDTWLRE